MYQAPNETTAHEESSNMHFNVRELVLASSKLISSLNTLSFTIGKLGLKLYG